MLAGYSYARSDDNDTGEVAFTYFPEQQFKVSTTYDLRGERWTVGGQLRWQSSIYNEGEECSVAYRVEQPAYTVVDLMAEYRLTEKASLYFNVENVFDETYYNGISYPVHGQTFGPPRTASLTLVAEF